MPVLDEFFSLLPSPGPSSKSVLLVDDDETILQTLELVLESDGFKVATARNVNQALKCIAGERFDVLVSDLHMPDHGDGLTVVSAMRHANPEAVTVIFSAFPEMNLAAAAIVKQADEVLVKPLSVGDLVKAIHDRLKDRASPVAKRVDSAADILEREIQPTIDDWLARIERQPQLIPVQLDRDERARFVPRMLRDLVQRLRAQLPLGTRSPISSAASEHGTLRRQQGYTPAMLAEESRMLQGSIFQTLQHNLQSLDYSLVLDDMMAIADEVASQLAQAMTCYQAESRMDPVLHVA